MLKLSIIQLYFISGFIMVLIDIYLNTKAFNSILYIKYQQILDLKFKDMFIILFIILYILLYILQYFNILEILGSHYSIFDRTVDIFEYSNTNNSQSIPSTNNDTPSSNSASLIFHHSADISSTVVLLQN